MSLWSAIKLSIVALLSIVAGAATLIRFTHSRDSQRGGGNIYCRHSSQRANDSFNFYAIVCLVSIAVILSIMRVYM